MTKGIRQHTIPLAWLTRYLDLPPDSVVLSAYIADDKVIVSVSSVDYPIMPIDVTPCAAGVWEGSTA